MAAKIVRLRTKADRLRAEQGARLRQLIVGYADDHDMPERAVAEIVAAIDRQTNSASGWVFVMVSPEINAAVVAWLIQNSSRPLVAVRLWAELFSHIRNDTCEIVRTRAELAATVGVAPNHLSEIMTELEGVGAISRKRVPHGVAYFMNPLVGTHTAGAARTTAQAAAKRLNFKPKAEKPPKRKKKKAKLALVPPSPVG